MGKYLDILDRLAGEAGTRELSEQSEQSCNSAPLTSLNSRPPPSYEWPMRALEQRRPDKVGVARWEQAVADARAFLATWGEQATALGWTAEDLFRLDPVAPQARYDAMGLLWSLQGQRVVALTDCSASIETPSGSKLTYRMHSR
jgi:hypothetical protein